MSESENIAAAPPRRRRLDQRAMDAEDRLRPEFVDEVLDAVEAGDDDTARALVEPLHPADVADLIELAARDEREGLVKALAGIVDADVLAEMNEHVREALLDALEPRAGRRPRRADGDRRRGRHPRGPRGGRAAGGARRRWSPTTAPRSRKRSTYPEESAGRLMQRDLIAVPEHWKVGQVIDYLRSSDELADDFWEVFVVDPSHHPVGTCKLSSILRSPRSSPVTRHHDATSRR